MRRAKPLILAMLCTQAEDSSRVLFIRSRPMPMGTNCWQSFAQIDCGQVQCTAALWRVGQARGEITSRQKWLKDESATRILCDATCTAHVSGFIAAAEAGVSLSSSRLLQVARLGVASRVDPGCSSSGLHDQLQLLTAADPDSHWTTQHALPVAIVANTTAMRTARWATYTSAVSGPSSSSTRGRFSPAAGCMPWPWP